MEGERRRKRRREYMGTLYFLINFSVNLNNSLLIKKNTCIQKGLKNMYTHIYLNSIFILLHFLLFLGFLAIGVSWFILKNFFKNNYAKQNEKKNGINKLII